MKPSQNDTLLKQLLIPVTAGIGLAYFAWQIYSDVHSSGAAMTASMWCAIGVMAAGSAYSLFTAWKRYRAYAVEKAAEIPVAMPVEPPAPSLPDLDPADAQDHCQAAEILAQLVTGNRPILDSFKRSKYDDCFHSYHCQCLRALQYLEQYEGDEQAMTHVAELTLDALEASWAARHIKAPDFKDQLLIALYLVPALRYEDHAAGTEFTDIFHSHWAKRYPQSVFKIGSYAEISEGFRKKTGMCFITTAVCQAEGKPDDCYELTSFRAFRDNWLAHQDGGEALIRRYYEVAPKIVTIIDHADDAPKIYAWIRDTYLSQCLDSIEKGDNRTCLERYRVMVEDLCERYQVD